jgi:hypothetical protein
VEPLGTHHVLRIGGDVRFRVIDGEAVVLRQSAAEVLVMNEVAARMLELADGAAPVARWVDALLAEYETDRPTLERDVLELAATLVSEGILEPVAGEEGMGGI